MKSNCTNKCNLPVEAKARAGILHLMDWPREKIIRVSECMKVGCMSSEEDDENEPTVLKVKQYTCHSDLWRECLREVDQKVAEKTPLRAKRRILKRVPGRVSDKKPILTEDQQWMCR